MATISQTAQLYDRALDFLKGWPHENALDHSAYLSSNVTVAPVYGGSVVHINASGDYELGHAGWAMPIFLIQGSHEYDVANDGGTEWYSILPVGKMSGLVATGGFELESTEVYQVGSPAYAPGDPLRAPTESQVNGSTKVGKAGMLFRNTAYAASTVAFDVAEDSVCAVVTKGLHRNHHRRYVVSFHPVYKPGATGK